MKYFPVFLKITARKCLVVGGGDSAVAEGIFLTRFEERLNERLDDLQRVVGGRVPVADGDLAGRSLDPRLDLAEETGGMVGDSLEMARFGKEHPAQTLIVAGVKFMGETAKILNPEKRVLMPTLAAECSLDLGCPPALFIPFCDAHPERTVVVYANTCAAVKARADWVVTSSIAVDVVNHLKEQGEKILWAPDRYLGSYVQRVTGADMLLWQGSCVVHEEFKGFALERLKRLHPEAAVLVNCGDDRDTDLIVVDGSGTVRLTQSLPVAARFNPRDLL